MPFVVGYSESHPTQQVVEFPDQEATTAGDGKVTPTLPSETWDFGSEPESGIEPLTYALRVRCSAG